MLQATLAASAGMLLSGSLIGGCATERSGGRHSAGARRPRIDKKIVVIGAGFSGLACAYELDAAGYDVLVIEARNRVGGRVLSFRDMAGGKVAEGGGELVGSNHPTWVAYARRFGLRFLDVTEVENASFPIILEGRSLNDDEAERLYGEMTAALMSVNEPARSVDAHRPWLSPDARALDHRSTADWLDSLGASDLCRAALRSQLTADNGVELEKQSFLANLAQVKGGGVDRFWTDSEVYRCRGGNDKLAQALAHALGTDRVRLGVRAARIDATRSGPVQVVADGGELFECDEVVLAVPPSVWGSIRMEPGMPAELRPQMGTNVKHLAQTSRRFWLDHGLAPDGLTDGDVQLTWEATDNQQRGRNEPAVLVAFSGGDRAERLRGLAPDARERVYREAIEAALPGYTQHAQASRFMDWPGEPLTRAGYSFPAPGEVTRLGPLLHAGLPRVRFAGEHTCYAFVGYMEGALHSGATVARWVAESDGVAASAAGS